jgi:hypothetical protein
MPSDNGTTIDPPQNPQLTISDLFKIINTEFTGKRDELSRFIRYCNYADELAANSQKDALFYYIVTRITGHASSQIEGKEVNGWPGLRDILIQLYGTNKSYTQLMEELNTIKQNPGESISSYLQGIEKLQGLALDSVRLSNNVTQQDGKCEAVRIIALQRFIRHSHNNISRYLRWKDPKTLSETYSLAIEEESALTERGFINPKSSRNSNFTKSSYHYHKQINFSKSVMDHQQQIQKSPNDNQPFRHSTKICNYCKKQGHLIHESRKRET